MRELLELMDLLMLAAAQWCVNGRVRSIGVAQETSHLEWLASANTADNSELLCARQISTKQQFRHKQSQAERQQLPLAK